MRERTYLTAPKSAPSHSFFSVSTVLSGSAAPVFLNVSNPASRSMKENLRFIEEGRDSRSRRPAGMTSRPIPSPGMRPTELSQLVFWRYSEFKSALSYLCEVFARPLYVVVRKYWNLEKSSGIIAFAGSDRSGIGSRNSLHIGDVCSPQDSPEFTLSPRTGRPAQKTLCHCVVTVMNIFRGFRM